MIPNVSRHGESLTFFISLRETALVDRYKENCL